MDTFQQSLDDAIAQVPTRFLEKAIAKKLREQGITETKTLSAKLAKHILEGKNWPLTVKAKKYSGNITLSFGEDDVSGLTKAIEHFIDIQILELIPNLAARASKKLLRRLRSRWPLEQTSQNADVSEFRTRLEERWGKPLGQLRMLLTMAREWGEGIHARKNSGRGKDKPNFKEILLRLHVRGCQVTDEIICLLENGFADGAMARWRTLHEIAVVAAVISQHGEDIAVRYISHQAVESKRAMNKYMSCCHLLGYKPLSAREIETITKRHEAAVTKYGKEFDTDYGWAASHLKKERVMFADLEVEAGRQDMRSHYQMGNDNVHAGIKSMFVRLGLLDGYQGLLSGRSNVGLMEPGQLAAYTLTQLSVFACLSEPNLDDLVVADMIRILRDEIPRSFYQADKQLRRDDKKYRALALENAGTINFGL